MGLYFPRRSFSSCIRQISEEGAVSDESVDLTKPRTNIRATLDHLRGSGIVTIRDELMEVISHVNHTVVERGLSREPIS